MVSLLRRRLPWPLPALFAWLLGWAVLAAGSAAGMPAWPAFAAAALAGLTLAATARGRWRRGLAAAGFPLSALALGALPQWPAWAWLAAALPLALVYPLRAWRDAPFFPTPAGALAGLDRVLALPDAGAGARVLDAGCGAGHGLQALRRLWPAARFEGIEFSRPLAWLAARRCRWASVSRADMWSASWAGVDLVYLFQRPESMARALGKAEREMPGGWLVSLEFEIAGAPALTRLDAAGRRPLWVYRIAGTADSTTRGGGR